MGGSIIDITSTALCPPTAQTFIKNRTRVSLKMGGVRNPPPVSAASWQQHLEFPSRWLK